MRFLANARNDSILCCIREAVAICSANRHCFPVTLHQLMLSFRTNPPSGGEVRNLQLKETVSWHKKKYILYSLFPILIIYNNQFINVLSIVMKCIMIIRKIL